MRRFVPGPFHGSTMQEESAGWRLTRRIDRFCSLMVLLACLCVWITAYACSTSPDPIRLIDLSCLAILALAAPGLWLIETTSGRPRLSASIVVAHVRQRLGTAATFPMPGVPEDAYNGLSGLIGDIALILRRRLNGPVPAALAAERREQLLQAGQDQARQLAFSLIDESATLGETATDLETATSDLLSETARAQDAIALADAAIADITTSAIGLARAVRVTTAQAEQSTQIAIHLSQTAFGAQRSLAALDEKTTSLHRAADGMAEILQRAGALGVQTGTDAARSGQAGRDLAASAVELQKLAATALAGLAAIQEGVTALRIETLAAHARLGELDQQIRGQHDLGHALGHAVTQQGEDIAAILARLSDAQSGFAMLRAGVQAVTRSAAARAASAALVRDAAKRLPGHAEAVAGLLRGLPDFKEDVLF